MDTRASGRGSIRHAKPRGIPARALSLAAGALLAIAAVTPVFAHADLVSSDPENRAVLDTPPTTITLTFSEGIVGKSSIKLVAPDGSTVDTAGPARDGDDTMALEGLTLGSGTYTIEWTSVADDGDVQRGKLTFTVTEPTPAPPTPTVVPSPTDVFPPPGYSQTPASEAPTAAVPTPAPSPSADTTPASSSGTDVLVPIVAALALVGVIGFLVLRRNRAA